MSKILIIGASGLSGLELTKLALDKGFETNVFLRNKSKLGDLAPKVKVYQGDATNFEMLDAAIKDSDVIISAVGVSKDSPVGMQGKIAKNIVQSMNQHGKKRLIALTGAGVKAEGDNPQFIDKLIVGIMKLVAKKTLDEAYEYVEIIKASKNIDWTIVRGPRLTNKPAKNEYKVGNVGDKHLSTEISRADLAKYMLDIIENPETYKKMPAVSW